jgi:hypothetical protein
VNRSPYYVMDIFIKFIVIAAKERIPSSHLGLHHSLCILTACTLPETQTTALRMPSGVPHSSGSSASSSCCSWPGRVVPLQMVGTDIVNTRSAQTGEIYQDGPCGRSAR